MKKILICILILAASLNFSGCQKEVAGVNGDNELKIALPVDPGKEGEKTLEGVDTDGDGVRDDIQIAIYKRYPNDQLKQDALKQAAKAIQKEVISGNVEDLDLALKATEESSLSLYCLAERFEDFSQEMDYLEYIFINTDERSEAYIKYNELLNGQIFGRPDGADSPCE